MVSGLLRYSYNNSQVSAHKQIFVTFHRSTVPPFRLQHAWNYLSREWNVNSFHTQAFEVDHLFMVSSFVLVPTVCLQMNKVERCQSALLGMFAKVPAGVQPSGSATCERRAGGGSRGRLDSLRRAAESTTLPEYSDLYGIEQNFRESSTAHSSLAISNYLTALGSTI